MGTPKKKRSASKAPARWPTGIPPLLPQPKQLRRRQGTFMLAEGMTLALPATTGRLDPSLLRAAQRARDEIEARTGIRLEIVRSRPASKTRRGPRFAQAVTCCFDRKAALTPRTDTAADAYSLGVTPTGVRIAAAGDAGLRHALLTLSQLASGGRKLPCVAIRDQPDFRDRGLMIDVSRGKVPTRSTLEDLVELCSRLRLNVLMLYVEHTFDWKRHPEIGRGASPLEAETILALDAFARERGVELVPCLQSLGHMERILSLDRYAKLAESKRRWSLSPVVPETYELLGDLYDEFLPLFSSKRFNANCDEPFDLGSDRAAGLAARIGRGAIFARHVERLRKLAAGHDKQLMIWADFALGNPDQIDALDRKTVLLDWWYEAEFDADRIGKLRRKGFEVWGCPGTSSWNCLFPRTENAERNVARWADAGRHHGASGILNTDWGDFGHYNALGVSLQGYAYGAQQAWSGEPDRRAFDRAFDREVFGAPSRNRAHISNLFRKLGAVHDAGFPIFNGSALQYLYFDPIGRSFFLSHARASALARSAGKLDRILTEIESLGIDQTADDFSGLALREIRWAAQATRLAVEKGLRAIEFNTWRGDPQTLRAADRRRLARQIRNLADQQRIQLAEFEILWKARNRVSEIALTRGRIRRSINGLVRAAAQLESDRPPRPAPPSELTLNNVYNEIRGEVLR